MVGHWEAIGPIIGGIAVAFGAVTVAMRVAAIAQAALNVVMDANPIGLLIIGIGALIGLIYVLATHWDKVKAAVSRAWGWFIKFGTEGPGRFLPIIGPIALIAKNWDAIKTGILGAWNAVLKFIDGVESSPLVKLAIQTYYAATRPPDDDPTASTPLALRRRAPIRSLPALAAAGAGAPVVVNIHNHFGPGTTHAHVEQGLHAGAQHIIKALDKRDRDRQRRSF
jgi:hypothetical protein